MRTFEVYLKLRRLEALVSAPDHEAPTRAGQAYDAIEGDQVTKQWRNKTNLE